MDCAAPLTTEWSPNEFQVHQGDLDYRRNSWNGELSCAIFVFCCWGVEAVVKQSSVSQVIGLGKDRSYLVMGSHGTWPHGLFSSPEIPRNLAVKVLCSHPYPHMFLSTVYWLNYGLFSWYYNDFLFPGSPEKLELQINIRYQGPSLERTASLMEKTKIKTQLRH